MPAQKPTAAGTKAQVPLLAACSRDGMSRDQTEAATMTPAANASRIRSSMSPICFFMKKTQAEPSSVPRNGMRSP